MLLLLLLLLSWLLFWFSPKEEAHTTQLDLKERKRHTLDIKKRKKERKR